MKLYKNYDRNHNRIGQNHLAFVFKFQIFLDTTETFWMSKHGQNMGDFIRPQNSVLCEMTWGGIETPYHKPRYSSVKPI